MVRTRTTCTRSVWSGTQTSGPSGHDQAQVVRVISTACKRSELSGPRSGPCGQDHMQATRVVTTACTRSMWSGPHRGGVRVVRITYMGWSVRSGPHTCGGPCGLDHIQMVRAVRTALQVIRVATTACRRSVFVRTTYSWRSVWSEPQAGALCGQDHTHVVVRVVRTTCTRSE